jgi:hypothetical protein
MKKVFPHFNDVEGWLDEKALLFTSYYASEFLHQDFDSIEIGVHHGKYFLGLENLTPVDGRSIAVDVFEEQHLNIDKSGCGDKFRFMENIAQWAVSPNRVEILQEDSMNVVPDRLGVHQFGLISIDGGHTREHTFHDLQTAKHLISHSGLIVLDDILHQHWLGVTTGALDFFNSPVSARIAPFAIGFNKLFITHFSVAEQRKIDISKNRDILERETGIQVNCLSSFGRYNILSLI